MLEGFLFCELGSILETVSSAFIPNFSVIFHEHFEGISLSSVLSLLINQGIYPNFSGISSVYSVHVFENFSVFVSQFYNHMSRFRFLPVYLVWDFSYFLKLNFQVFYMFPGKRSIIVLIRHPLWPKCDGFLTFQIMNSEMSENYIPSI